MDEAHESRYSIYPGATKMYHHLCDIYWLNRMKREEAKFVSMCRNCQQVKVDHQDLVGVTKDIDIPT